MSTQLSRPERNNNPGDIRAVAGVTWIGQLRQDEDGFVVFSHRYYGIRAMAITLCTYFFVHNCQTLREIIERWSPPSENNTEELIAKASHRLEIHPDEHLVIEYVLPSLISALCYQEDPVNTITGDTIAYGLMMAQVYPA